MATVLGGPGGRLTPQNVPQRTTKVSEKLVLIPDAPDEEDLDDDAILEEDEAARRRLIEEEEDRPLRDVELDVLKKRGGIRGKSYAERLPKRQRAEKVSRLTAYCTAEGFKTKATAEFLRTKHEAKTKLYDDCLYVVYHLPLMSGLEGYRVRSRPILKTPGTGKTVLDLEIERSERRDHHYGYYEDYAGSPSGTTEPTTLESISGNGTEDGSHLEHPDDHRPFSPINRLAPDAKNFAEMFVFSYGVVVFWNFTEHQEKDILGDLNFAESEKGGSLVIRPFDPNDYETEEFHFEYSAQIKHPRIFNDMITLLPRSDHMVKLGISHAVAQSTKLCSFEERMSETMQGALPVPKTMAATGDLNMGRDEIVKVLGRLFKSRVDINLCTFPTSSTHSLPKLFPATMQKCMLTTPSQLPTSSPRPTSSGSPSPPSRLSTPPSATTSRSTHASRSSTSAAASSSTSPRSCPTLSPMRRCPPSPGSSLCSSSSPSSSPSPRSACASASCRRARATTTRGGVAGVLCRRRTWTAILI